MDAVSILAIFNFKKLSLKSLGMRWSIVSDLFEKKRFNVHPINGKFQEKKSLSNENFLHKKYYSMKMSENVYLELLQAKKLLFVNVL